jgi:hypothetical protein
MRHTVIIKGSIAEAVLAANERGIVLYDIQPHTRFREIIAQADSECYPEIVQWFCAPVDVEAQSAAPGTLMWYSEARVFGKRERDAFAADLLPPAVTAPVTGLEFVMRAACDAASRRQQDSRS